MSVKLTAALRNNLLSLQKIAGKVNTVSSTLSTGLKVASPLDNPNSYYTSVSLRNRAQDLNQLLDSISISVKALKNTTNSLSFAINLLNQAEALASQTLYEHQPLPEPDPDDPSIKELSRQKLANLMHEKGISGTIVGSADELKAEVAKGTKDIIIWGDINLDNKYLILSNGARLVGGDTILRENNLDDQYKIADTHKATLNFKIGTNIEDNKNAVIFTAENSYISDITINYDTAATTNIIQNEGHKGVVLNNLVVNINNRVSTGVSRSVINNSVNYGEVKLTGDNKIEITGTSIGFHVINNAYYAKFELETGAVLDMKNISGIRGGKANYINGIINAENNNIIYNSEYTEVNGVINVFNPNASSIFGNSAMVFKDGSKINVISPEGKQNIFIKNDNIKNLTFEKNAYVSYTTAHKTEVWTSSTNGVLSVGAVYFQTGDRLNDLSNAWVLDTLVPPIDFSRMSVSPREGTEKGNNGIVYQQILEQFEQLINDSSYKNVNFLRGDNLTVSFNEDRSSRLEILGTDLSLENLALEPKTWTSEEDIRQSLEEIRSAIHTLRDTAGRFGNYYTIILTREAFTEKIIDILEEGADKITLADMNQESAKMLALQTAQKLATQALSLSAEGNKKILDLFQK